MIIARTKAQLREALGSSNGVGLVPTMGAFHEGHLSLMRAARTSCDMVAVSLFVNPLQFGKNEDLANYPRNEERDFYLAKQEGVDIVFAPTPEEVYADGDTAIRVGRVGESFEGSFRPGHFDGVATVVLKLFNMFRPARAFFGLKDLQQCAVVRRMAKDLDLGLQLEFLETVREPSGLAMSSRNVYLSPKERTLASQIYQTLLLVRTKWQDNPKEVIMNGLDAHIDSLNEKGVSVQYMEIVDWNDMRATTNASEVTHVIIAAKIAGVRLIDNLSLAPLQTSQEVMV